MAHLTLYELEAALFLAKMQAGNTTKKRRLRQRVNNKTSVVCYLSPAVNRWIHATALPWLHQSKRRIGKKRKLHGVYAHNGRRSFEVRFVYKNTTYRCGYYRNRLVAALVHDYFRTCITQRRGGTFINFPDFYVPIHSNVRCP